MSSYTHQICVNCSDVFAALTAEIKRGNGKFCSHSCSAIYGNIYRKKRLSPNCVCAQCNKEFYRNASKRKNSKSGLQFCSRKCKDIAQRIGGIEAIHPDHYNTGALNYRAQALRHYSNKCNRCGYSKCLTIIEVHHKNRDRSNNQLENLELLCRNCHGEEHHMD